MDTSRPATTESRRETEARPPRVTDLTLLLGPPVHGETAREIAATVATDLYRSCHLPEAVDEMDTYDFERYPGV